MLPMNWGYMNLSDLAASSFICLGTVALLNGDRGLKYIAAADLLFSMAIMCRITNVFWFPLD